MPIIIINSKLRGAEQDSVPYMMKVILIHIPVECGVVDLYVYRILNGSGSPSSYMGQSPVINPELRINNDSGHAHRTTISGNAQSLPA